MKKLIIPTRQQIPECAQVYVKSLLQEPWFEDNSFEATEVYFLQFLQRDGYFIYAYEVNGKIAAVCVGEQVPCIDKPFIRIEDFCVAPEFMRLGLGSDFITEIQNEAKKKGCDCVILATVRDFPSHKFYNKNGFSELENSVYLYKEI